MLSNLLKFLVDSSIVHAKNRSNVEFGSSHFSLNPLQTHWRWSWARSSQGRKSI